MLATYRPDEIYNLAGITSIGHSWEDPDLTRAVNAEAFERMLDAVLEAAPGTRIFQASSSEVFGPDAASPQDESTPHAPANPYAESKSRAHLAAIDRREKHGLFVSVGILYNHESPLRGAQFFTRKVTRGVAEIAADRRERLVLGNLDVSRDWGSASDYVRAMHRALRHPEPLDFTIATGRLQTLRHFVEVAFAAAGVDDPWSHIEQDPALMRQADNPGLTGDPSRARDVLGWETSLTFEDLVDEMVRVDQARLRTGVEESADYLRDRRADA